MGSLKEVIKNKTWYMADYEEEEDFYSKIKFTESKVFSSYNAFPCGNEESLEEGGEYKANGDSELILIYEDWGFEESEDGTLEPGMVTYRDTIEVLNYSESNILLRIEEDGYTYAVDMFLTCEELVN
jgi:hypothetical protein